MGACATKPLEIMNRAPEEVHEENSTPRSAEVTVPSAETTTAAEVIKKIMNILETCERNFSQRM
jgi:hypothetical protein